MDFSLLYFANREVDDPPAEYDLLFEATRYADENGFTALWIPERHFHPFGGAYPNPALAAAALAMSTSRIRLRAGSVVLPLHDPLTVVEDWSFVDNLSRGRVDLALATGWHPNDFVLRPERYADRRRFVAENVEVVRDLWCGKSVTRRNGEGAEVEISTYPRPVQPTPNIWLTCASNVETFEQAGALGANLLTALLFQKLGDLAPKIDAYRAARERHGHDPGAGVVTLMVHTFVGTDDAEVKETVRGPFTDYLLSSVDLWRGQWPDMEGAERSKVAEFAFARYFRQAAMFGSVDKCVKFARRLEETGVDEIASLIDFGVPAETVLAALPHLNTVRQRLQSP
jgi:natural product biosynthesis luciferase-like monooxygenase protein